MQELKEKNATFYFEWEWGPRFGGRTGCSYQAKSVKKKEWAKLITGNIYVSERKGGV